MWNLTPESIQQVKEELKGRRAAIQARHAEELKSLEADLEEIETLERVAYAVAAKHAPEPAIEPVEVEAVPEPDAVPQAVAELEAEPVVASEPEPAPLRGPKSLSRWRMRLDTNSETESA
jgi:hypothetical protein